MHMCVKKVIYLKPFNRYIDKLKTFIREYRGFFIFVYLVDGKVYSNLNIFIFYFQDLSPYSLWLCIKKGSLELFDKITATDVIPLTEQIRLVRYRDSNSQTKNCTQLADK